MIHTETQPKTPDYLNVRNVKYLVSHDGVQEWRTGKISSYRGTEIRGQMLLGIDGVRPNGEKTDDQVLNTDPDLIALPNDPAPKHYSRFRRFVNRMFQWD